MRWRRGGSVPVSTMIAIAVVIAWMGIISPGVFDADLAAKLSPMWWTVVIAYLVCFFAMRPALATPRTGAHQVPALILAGCGGVATLIGPIEGLSPVLLCVTTALIGFVVPPREVVVVVLLEWPVLGISVYRGNEVTQWAAAFAGMILFAAIMVEVSVREFYARRLVGQTMAELEQAHGQLAAAQAQLAEQSRAEERLRISRDLHDAIGHQLTALSLNLEVASHIASGPVREHVVASRELAIEVLRDVRGVVSKLREPGFDLADGLHRLANDTVSPETTVDIGPAVAAAPRELKVVVFRVVQECLTNVVRHSGAHHAWVAVDVVADDVVVQVRDDGHGAMSVTPGNGLQGMRERVEAYGGSLGWNSRPDHGFAVTARIPVGV